MQSFSDTLGQVFRAIAANKLRSFLTMFGIAWGVGSLLVLVGLGEGFRSGQHKNFATLGNDVIMMFNGTIPALANQHTGMRPYKLTLGDLRTEPQRSLRSEPVEQYLQPRDGDRTQLSGCTQYSHGPGTFSGRCRPGRIPARRSAGFEGRHAAV